eukprot:TRINITY_DN134_c0_g2_i10.p1 TRINITY_DN134_c0_g2~~TRINITY_DN134_c0_g2_i10.p1  ORF type:complete len:426 (-),score=148.65 TRINITY_DN134_c0_g2_i10:123-1400(-)
MMEQKIVERRSKCQKPLSALFLGCFDLMHSGHYNALRQARGLCDRLVVGSHAQTDIHREKGKPIMSEEERNRAVKECKWVDELITGVPYLPITNEFLDEHNCAFAIHGDDLPRSTQGSMYGELIESGRLRIIKRTEGVSTTTIVSKIMSLVRNKDKDVSIEKLEKGEEEHVSEEKDDDDETLVVDIEKKDDGLYSLTELITPCKGENSIETEEDESNASIPNKPSSDLHNVSTFLPTSRRIMQFAGVLKEKPKHGKVVYIDGDFDLYHIGHMQVLKEAKALGDWLVVGVHSDETVQKLKGVGQPFTSLHERVLNVLSNVNVDDVIIGANHMVSDELLKLHNISVVASARLSKSDSDSCDIDFDPYKIAKDNNIFVDIQKEIPDLLQTDNIIERLVAHREEYENRQKNTVKKELNFIASREFVAEL